MNLRQWMARFTLLTVIGFATVQVPTGAATLWTKVPPAIQMNLTDMANQESALKALRPQLGNNVNKSKEHLSELGALTPIVKVRCQAQFPSAVSSCVNKDLNELYFEKVIIPQDRSAVNGLWSQATAAIKKVRSDYQAVLKLESGLLIDSTTASNISTLLLTYSTDAQNNYNSDESDYHFGTGSYSLKTLICDGVALVSVPDLATGPAAWMLYIGGLGCTFGA